MSGLPLAPRGAARANSQPSVRRSLTTRTTPAAAFSSADLEFITVNEAELDKAMLVVDLSPERSQVSLIGHFLLMQLKMQLLGAFYSEQLPPVAVSEEGLVIGTLQVWRGVIPCGPGQGCEKLLVLKSDAPIETNLSGPLAAAVTRWAAGNGIDLIAAFDGYERATPGPDEVLLGSSMSAYALAKSLPLTPVPHSLLYGFSAALLSSANRDGVPVLCFFAPAAAEDAATVARENLMSAAPILPALNLDPTHVDHELHEIQDALHEMEEGAMRARRADTSRGYA